MKIALIGYGKMGKIIDEIAISRGHEVVARLNETPTKENLANAEVAIEFSTPETAFSNIKTCLDLHIPVICGTTGWLSQLPDIEAICLKNESAFLYASNFSLGVNLFFALNTHLAQLMQNFPDYKCQLEEIHHTQKLDAPSGTAITLANGITTHSNYKNWQLGKSSDHQLGIIAKREENVPGTHSVFYQSMVDEIEIKHTAFNRKGFATGAVVAAEWIVGKKGLFTMNHVLNLS